ncbi:MAG: hypothetical protein IT323_12020, partial [Anaerolineae bacterium]|nr:hypothetical protein [Anaerolineae bacterium]
MRRWLVLFMLCALVLGGPATASAQDDDSEVPFMEMLAAVPREAAADQGLITYADYHALINARPGSFVPRDMTEFDTANQQDDPRFPVLMAALNGLGTGMSGLVEVFRIDGMREAVGFDFFTVQRALEFGQPPAAGNILQGDFDPAAIGAALTARGFTEQPVEGVEGGLLWCSVDGCEAGRQISVRDRNPADPFGGQMGRKQPLMFAPPDMLLSSASNDVVQAMFASQQSPDDASILSLPEYRAAAEAITARGALLQAVIAPAALITEGMEPAGRSGLPRYELAVFAHIRAETDVLTLVGLVYPNERLASQATDILPVLFNEAESLHVRRTFAEMVEERGGTVGKGLPYVSPESGYAVALLEFRSEVEAPDVAP